MRMVFLMVIMLVAGLSLGAGGATLVWSQMHSSATGVAKDWQKSSVEWEGIAKKWEMASKKFESVAIKNADGWRECIQIARR